jgi:hypothetical protein
MLLNYPFLPINSYRCKKQLVTIPIKLGIGNEKGVITGWLAPIQAYTRLPFPVINAEPVIIYCIDSHRLQLVLLGIC